MRCRTPRGEGVSTGLEVHRITGEKCTLGNPIRRLVLWREVCARPVIPADLPLLQLSGAAVYGWDTLVLLKHFLDKGLSKTAIAQRLGVSGRAVYHWIATGQLERDT
jgi:hypothetical protein